MAKKSIANLDVTLLSLDNLVEIAQEILALKAQQDALVSRLSALGLGKPSPTPTVAASRKRTKPVGTRKTSPADKVFKSLAALVKKEAKELGHHKQVENYSQKKAEIWEKASATGEGLKLTESLESASDKEKVRSMVQQEVKNLKNPRPQSA